MVAPIKQTHTKVAAFGGGDSDVSRHPIMVEARHDRNTDNDRNTENSPLPVHIKQNELEHILWATGIGELAPGLMHELAQPLMAIEHLLHSATIMLARNDDLSVKTIRDLLNDARHQTKRAGNVIRQLRKFTRRSSQDNAPLDLEPVIRAAVELIHPVLVTHKINVHVDCPTELPRASADPQQTELLLLNMLRNAIEIIAATAPEKRSITISTRLDSEDLVISVVASGVGKSSIGDKSILNPLNTLQRDSIEFRLALCRSIIQANGGKLWATPCEGGGTDFRFTLPQSRESKGTP